MKEFESIFWELFKSNSETDVDKVLNKYPELFKDDNWHPYGDNIGNTGTFENQQSSAIPALVEKITNSIDAILMKECYDKGIDPKSEKAPKSMKEAVEIFFKVKNGEISEMHTPDRSKLSNKLQIIATGKKDNVSILIYDEGIGQKHTEFSNTFLSLHNNNKADIHFVQGKYNMGSTGSVVFCGEKKYQLIGSLYNGNDRKDNEFGYTLVRRHPLNQNDTNVKMTWYEYFKPNKKIPFFDMEDADFGLVDNLKFNGGSIVKLYSYEFPTGSKGDISTDLYRDLNQYMFDLPIPVKVYETRDHYKLKNVSKVILGNRARIATDRNENVEVQIPLNLETSINDIHISVPINIVVFKPGVDEREFIKRKCLIFTINGQIHASQGWSFITQALQLQLLRKSTLINVDCTNIPIQIRQDLFMANRTNFKESRVYEELMTKLTELIKSNKKLKEINQSRKDLILRDSSNDKDLLKSLMSNLPVDKDVLSLLKKDGNLDFLKKFSGSNLKSFESKIDKEKPKLNRFPSIFKVKTKSTGKAYKTIPLNGRGNIEIQTDVSNDYLFRPVEKGEFKIEILQKRPKTNIPVNPNNKKPPNEVTDILNINREGPDDGKIKLIISPNSKAKIGDEVSVRASLSSPGGDLECIFDVKVDKKISNPKKKEKNQSNSSFPNLPLLKKAYKDEQSEEGNTTWKDLGWNGDDIVKVIMGDGDKNNNIVEAIIINMDSYNLQRFISKNRINDSKKISLVSKKYYTSIYFHTLFLYSIFFKIKNEDSEDDYLKNTELDMFISKLIKPYSNFLIYENYHMIGQISDD